MQQREIEVRHAAGGSLKLGWRTTASTVASDAAVVAADAADADRLERVHRSHGAAVVTQWPAVSTQRALTSVPPQLRVGRR